MNIRKKLQKENLDFAKQWQIIRASGRKSYIFRQMRFLGTIMFGTFLINALIDEDMNYLLTGIIYLLIVLIFPCLSWLISEWRFGKANV
jgi:uncharacterized membrane protein YcaP (DUF421 family)